MFQRTDSETSPDIVDKPVALTPSTLARPLMLNVFYHCGYCLLIASLPAEMLARDYDTSSIGLIVGAFAVGAIAVRLLFARAMDRLKLRTLFRISSFLVIIGSLLYVIAGVSIAMVVGRAVHGAACAFFATAFAMWISHNVPPESRGTIRGLEGSIVGLCVVIGPVAGLLIYEAFGQQTVNWVLVALSSATLIIPLGGSERCPPGESPSLRRRLPLITGLAIAGAVLGAMQSFLPMLAQWKNVESLGVIFIIFGIGLVIGRGCGGCLSDMMGCGPIMRIGAAVVAASLAMVWLNDQISFLYLACGLFGIGIGAFTTSSLTQMLHETAGRPGQAAALSGASLASELGLFAGPALIGIVGNSLGAAGIGATTTCLAFILLIPAILVPKKKAPI